MDNIEKKSFLYFPFNIGSGNRGCEGIIKGIYKILGDKFYYILLDKNEEEKEIDISFDVSQFAKICVKSNLDEFSMFQKYIHKIIRKLGLRKRFYRMQPYLYFLENARQNDIVMFTGGDLFCYDNMSELNADIHKEIKKKRIKTILYGCSISKEFLSPFIVKQLKNFDLIVCRESISIENLKECDVIENVVFIPDPAFVLEPEKCNLPGCFSKKVIGINISDLVGFNTNMESVYAKNIEKLIEYIIKNTEYHILLIPHVTWSDQDDREICEYFNELFVDSHRLTILDINKLSYMQIRYVISNCYLFIGARTHSVISAYSTCIPTLALGYSVKSLGIAKDLGIDEKFVLDCKNLKSDNEMIDRFKILMSDREELHEHLLKCLPEYKYCSFSGGMFIEQIMNVK